MQAVVCNCNDLWWWIITAFSGIFMLCGVEDCFDEHHAMGYCRFHYARWREAVALRSAGNEQFSCTPEDVGADESAASNCQVKGCGLPGHQQGWCVGHYAKWRRGLPASLIVNNRICVADDCERPVRCKGLCALHYQRFRNERIKVETSDRYETEADSTPVIISQPEMPDTHKIVGVMALRGRLSIKKIAKKFEVTESMVLRIFESHELSEGSRFFEEAGISELA
ncbi:hypothetical protein JJB09_10745 [Rhizobium sp. KVB221]|uniref:Uncharacterized protein n=1 Tax=Rhizobium setariae TaxID=2801340 RepID=A0A936YTJ4_9HYPH|nr:hypothetical protein [Rhizobium setariae]MBL0372507.1 hypothetical protein [Rhizobium setariae]